MTYYFPERGLKLVSDRGLPRRDSDVGFLEA